MLFQVAQAEESDLRDIAMRLDQAAMSDNGINQTLDKVLAQQNKSRADFFLEYISGGFKNDRETFWKVVDSDTGDLVAAAWYGFHVAGDRQSKQSSPSPPSKDVGVAPAVQQSSEDAYLMEVMTKLFRDWHDFKKEHIRDQPHASLHYIATHPEYQHRGAGTLLLNKGNERADEAGLDLYLQASEKGLRAYEKSGYRIVQTDSIDLGEFGVERTETRYCMRREAVKKLGGEIIV